MTAGLQALLSSLIDYAGLFPPAALALDQALRNYAAYRRQPERWMLARFLCPSTRLKDLAHHDELAAAGPGFNLAVLGQGGKTTQEFAEALLNDFQSVKAFIKKHGRRAHIGSVEIRLPLVLLTGEKGAQTMQRIVLLIATQADEALADQGLPLVSTFFEIETGPQWLAAVRDLLPVLREDPLRRRGFKLRCGGPTAAAVPTPAEVAEVMDLCRVDAVPMKFTAGMHHPVRCNDAALKTPTHGFFNIFVAGVLAHAREIASAALTEIIADEKAASFEFDESGLRWRHLHATVDEITQARQQFVTSFGSCSFDEPRDHLRTMGLLTK